MTAPAPRPMHTTFQEIKVHTAKCDECNKHNLLSIYRCATCGQQCCTPCWNSKAGDGTHLTSSMSPVIIAADDVKKERLRRKEHDGEDKTKKVARKTKKVKKDSIGQDREMDSDHPDGASNVIPQPKKTGRAKKQQVKNSHKKALPDNDNVDDDALVLQSDSVPKQTVKDGKKPTANAAPSIKSRTESTNTRTSSKGAPENKKRKHTSNPGDDEMEKAMFAHAAAEGRKRVRTGSKSPSSNTPSLRAKASPEEEPQTLEYANYLLQLSRGDPADGPSEEEPAGSLPSPPSDNDNKNSTKGHEAAATRINRDPAPNLKRPSLAGMHRSNGSTITLPAPSSGTLNSDKPIAQSSVQEKPQRDIARIATADGDEMEIDLPNAQSPSLTHQTHAAVEGSPISPHTSPITQQPALTQTSTSETKQNHQMTSTKTINISTTQTVRETIKTGSTALPTNNPIHTDEPNVHEARRTSPDSVLAVKQTSAADSQTNRITKTPPK